MELSGLKYKIIESFRGSAADLEEVLERLEEDKSIFPFNEYEHIKQDNIDKLAVFELHGDNLEKMIKKAAKRN